MAQNLTRILALLVLTIQCLAMSGNKERWEMVWHDEFDKPGLPDTSKWSGDIGFLRNEEPQYYTGLDPDNCWQTDGFLTITARAERTRNARFQADSDSWRNSREVGEYTSSSLRSKNNKSWLYGRIEIRAKLPGGHGTWPTFWTIGEKRHWPQCGEIDILEYWGADAKRNFGTVHYQKGGEHLHQSHFFVGERPWEEFHVYGVEWNEKQIEFFVDGVSYHVFIVEEASEGDFNPFRQPHFLLLNLALKADNDGKVRPETLPARFVIDWVRVWQKK